MKKMTLALSALSFFAIASTALAQGQGFVPLAPITGLTDPATLNAAGSKNLADFFNNLYKYAIGLAAVLAVIQIIWAGLNIALHQDNVSSITDSKGKIYNAIFGLVLVLSPVLVFSIINPNILNLSLSLPVLNRAAPSATTGGGTVTAPSTGCTMTHSGPYLETAVCAQGYAGSYICSNGLTPIIPPCKVSNAASKKCLDTSTTVYCAGKKSAPLVFYAFTTFKGLKINLSSIFPVPRDKSTANTFASSCSTDGGVVTRTLTTGATVAVQGITGLLLSTVYSGCSSEYGVIPVDTNQYSGAQCFSAVMSCNPPN